MTDSKEISTWLAKSIAETISHCYVVFDQGYIFESDLQDLLRQADIVRKSTKSSMAYLKRSLSELEN